MELSKRLQAVADLVGEGLIVADVGTDHGYIPIYLLETEKCPKAIAMDINRGPLLRAREHIKEHGLDDKIEVRQSDGVKALSKGECNCIVIAGMGGALAISILEEGKTIFREVQEFVLQPQSELAKVRQYLWENGYAIVAEDMVLEDGKFYPMMKVRCGQASEYSQIELCYGKRLLEQKHPILKLFLEKEVRTRRLILKKLESETGEHIENRKKELEEELFWAKEALQVYF